MEEMTDPLYKRMMDSVPEAWRKQAYAILEQFGEECRYFVKTNGFAVAERTEKGKPIKLRHVDTGIVFEVLPRDWPRQIITKLAKAAIREGERVKEDEHKT